MRRFDRRDWPIRRASVETMARAYQVLYRCCSEPQSVERTVLQRRNLESLDVRLHEGDA